MNDKMEMKESVVNEEYQEQEPQEGCCSENEQFHPCCCEKEKRKRNRLTNVIVKRIRSWRT